jgi:hypothetical protein
MLRRSIISLATIAALAMTVPEGAFAAGHPGGHGPSGGHFAGGGPRFGGGAPRFGGGAPHVGGPGGGRFVGGRGFSPGYGPGYYYGGGPDYGGYPPDYGYYDPGYGYYEPESDYGAAAALGAIAIISGIVGSHLYHRHCWLHHGRRLCR